MPSMICPSCNNPAPPGAIFCDNCGFDLRSAPAGQEQQGKSDRVNSTMGDSYLTCINCGHKNPAGSAYCENCGHQILLQENQKGIEDESGQQTSENEPIPLSPAPSDAVSGDSLIVDSGSPSAKEGKTMKFGKLHLISLNKIIPIPENMQIILIGREDPASGVFPDINLDSHGGHKAGVGRKHAQMSLKEGAIYIEDLESVNGTFLNRQKLSPRTPQLVKDGDEIRLGKMILVYRAE